MKIWQYCVDSHRDHINVYCSLDLLQWQGPSPSLWEKVTAHWRTVSETSSPGCSPEHTWDLSRDPQGAQSCYWPHLREAGGRPRQVEGLHEQVVVGGSPKDVVSHNYFNSDIVAKQVMKYVSSYSMKKIRWYGLYTCSCTKMLHWI